MSAAAEPDAASAPPERPAEHPATRPTRAPWSIRRRLVLGVVALVALVGILLGAVSVLALRQNLIERLDAQVHDISRFWVAGGGGQLPGGTDALQAGLVLAAATSSSAQGVSLNAPGQVSGLTARQLAQVLGASVDHITTVDIAGLGSYRVEVRASPTRLAAVGLSTSEVDTTTATLVLIFALVALGVLGLAAAGALAVANVALRPLGRVAETAGRVAELDLASGEAAIPERVPDAEADPRTEVGQVGAALNHMLGHVESALVARERSEQQMRRFVADASHELRTPLASIRGYAELTRRSGERLPADAVRSLDRIESESVRMTALVEDLLELARLDEGQQLAFGEVELVRLVTDAVGDAYAAAPDHEWELVAPDPPLTVMADAPRLQQVVVNLLANASRHTPRGTAVTVTLESAVDGVRLTVADDGPGIPEELRARLFERFARGDAARTRASGSTGLGLAIVAAVVEAHHGEVEVVSAPGATRFTVCLPWRQPISR